MPAEIVKRHLLMRFGYLLTKIKLVLPFHFRTSMFILNLTDVQ